MENNQTTDKGSKGFKPAYLALALFCILFIAGAVMISYFGKTNLFFSVILLMLQVVIAICLSKLNYACLFIAGVIELAFGIIASATLVTVICLVVYFCALYTLHILNKYGFKELTAGNAA
ncbi:MAG: hypothetical protein IJT81_00190 [Lachnospiraceae bacterium]|nr:hypothetical protein [Lachnospiraceae bacterium]